MATPKFEDTDLLTQHAGLHAYITVSDQPSDMVNLEPTVTVSAHYWNRLMALRAWALEVSGLEVET